MSAQPAGARRRSASDSRERLLAAAQQLFAERGYDRTTVREIGSRAGADPALIARYFGSKAALYLAALARTKGTPGQSLDVTDPVAVAGLLTRAAAHGSTPTLHAAVEPHGDAELQAAALEMLRERLIDPSRETAQAVRPEDAELRAHLATAALAGIALSRASGALDVLAGASADEVAALVAPMLAALLGALPGADAPE